MQTTKQLRKSAPRPRALSPTNGTISRPIQPQLSGRFTKAVTAIQKTGVNALVFVGDVDRLHADELLTVRKAVQLLGRFDRVVWPVRGTAVVLAPGSVKDAVAGLEYLVCFVIHLVDDLVVVDLSFRCFCVRGVGVIAGVAHEIERLF
ncbi:Uncharacterised protein [Mycobacteroides abscessus subsp. massiliense]|nr:Uncharacterised protein [Mycobacteroides abscessus subsp. massiliense]